VSICLSCYKPIEQEKVAVLPDARYCMKCAHAMMVAPSKRKKSNNGNGHISMVPTQMPTQLLLPDSSTVLTTDAPKVVYVKRPSVLKEEVFDDGKCSTSMMKRHRKRKSSPSAWRYSNGGEAKVGDIVGQSDDCPSWVVVEVDANVIHCRRAGESKGTASFYIRMMELFFRESELSVDE